MLERKDEELRVRVDLQGGASGVLHCMFLCGCWCVLPFYR